MIVCKAGFYFGRFTWDLERQRIKSRLTPAAWKDAFKVLYDGPADSEEFNEALKSVVPDLLEKLIAKGE